MKKVLMALMLVVGALSMQGCSQQVPVGTIGKIIAPEGVTPEVYQPGRPSVWGRDRLVLIETATQRRFAPVTVTMADRRVNEETGELQHEIGLDMDFKVNVRYRINTTEQVINAMLEDTVLEGVDRITAEQVYMKYGFDTLGRVSREVLGQYTPEEVLGNLENINKLLDARMKEEMKNTPLIISSVSLGPISLPKVITDRIAANKDTELSEAQKRAQQKIDLLDEANRTALAQQKAVRDEVDARSLANQNRILNESITPEVLELRRLQLKELEIEMQREVLRAGLDKGNSSVFIPYGSMGNSGLQNRMYSQ